MGTAVTIVMEMFELFVYAMKNSFNIKGRACRKEFISFLIMIYVITYILGFVFALAMTPKPYSDFIGHVLIPFLFMPALICVGVRRLHDVNLNGLFILPFLIGSYIPSISNYVMVAGLYLFVIKKGVGLTNKYGEESINY